MPLLQVRDCPEDIYRKITQFAKQQNRTIAQQVVVLDVSAALEILLDKTKKPLFNTAFQTAAWVIAPDL